MSTAGIKDPGKLEGLRKSGRFRSFRLFSPIISTEGGGKVLQSFWEDVKVIEQ